MIAKRIISLVLLCALSLAVSGCAAVVVGGAAAGSAYVYVTGQAKQQFNNDLSASYQAALTACKELNLKIESSKKRLSEAEVKAKDVDTTVFIDLSSVSSRVTEISVRYGMLGDEQASARILSAISRNLKK